MVCVVAVFCLCCPPFPVVCLISVFVCVCFVAVFCLCVPPMFKCSAVVDVVVDVAVNIDDGGVVVLVIVCCVCCVWVVCSCACLCCVCVCCVFALLV